MAAAETRQQIIEAADRLFYQGGFEATSFADIAAAVKLSRGNFYYHFKSKNEILAAVMARRLDDTRAMLERWEEKSPSAAEAIRSFIGSLATNGETIMAYGCPVGTMCAELAKLDHAGKPQAAAVFSLFRGWLFTQFERLGCGDKSDMLAMHLLMRIQGVAALATAFADHDFMRREMDDMLAWLDAQVPLAPSMTGPA